MKKIGMLKTYKSDEINDSYISIGFECIDRELINPDKCYDLLAETGVKYARCQTGWARCEKEKGIYDFTWLDSIVDNLLSRGIKPWLNVGYGNPVYMKDIPNPTGVGCVPIFYGEETLIAWKNFVKEIAIRYKDKVSHYEIWNESDIGHFWYPEQPNGKEYAKFVKLTGKVIREVNPNAKIGGNVSNAYKISFMREFLSEVDKKYLDFFAIHVYTTVPEYRYSSIIYKLRKMFDEKGLHDVEFWQGEGGYPSWAYEGHWLAKDGCDDERPQAVWQLRRYFLDVFNGLKLSSFFQIADMWEKPYEKAVEVIKKPAAHGILNGITYTPKKSYETISHLSAIFNGDLKPSDYYMDVNVNSPTTLEFLSPINMTFEKNGTPIYSYYMPTEIGKPFEYSYKLVLSTLDHLDNPVVIDMYSGEVFSIEKENVVYCNGFESYTDLPIKDYPIIVTDRSVIEIV